MIIECVLLISKLYLIAWHLSSFFVSYKKNMNPNSETAMKDIISISEYIIRSLTFHRRGFSWATETILRIDTSFRIWRLWWAIFLIFKRGIAVIPRIFPVHNLSSNWIEASKYLIWVKRRSEFWTKMLRFRRICYIENYHARIVQTILSLQMRTHNWESHNCVDAQFHFKQHNFAVLNNGLSLLYAYLTCRIVEFCVLQWVEAKCTVM